MALQTHTPERLARLANEELQAARRAVIIACTERLITQDCMVDKDIQVPNGRE